MAVDGVCRGLVSVEQPLSCQVTAVMLNQACLDGCDNE